jgi:DNA recombination protein RmuC
MEILIGISALLGLITGFFMALKFSSAKSAEAEQRGALSREAEISALQERVSNSQQGIQRSQAEVLDLKVQIQEIRSEKEALLSEKATLTVELDLAHNNLLDLKKNEESLQQKFENLANKIFEEKGKVFSEKNYSRLNEVLEPFSKSMSEFKKDINEKFSKEGEGLAIIQNELKRLQSLNETLSKEADNLSRALKGEKKTQGNWGELVLEKVLESSGLRKGLEYETQSSFRNDENKLLLPDVLIRLPEGKTIIVDSKVSLNSYEKSVSSEDEFDKAAALKEHVEAIKNHIDTLNLKDYSGLPDINSLDFTLMFIPIESAFMAALEYDKSLFQYGFNKKIIIVTPTTLLATLRTIESIWKYEKQSKNALKISEQAGKMYDKFVDFVTDMEQLGSRMDTSKKSWDSAWNKLSQGTGNLIGRSEQLRELGVKVRKQLPENLTSEEFDAVEPDEPLT